MRLTRSAAIGIALVCAGLAVVLALVYLKGTRRQMATPSKPTQVEVVVPNEDIAPSSVITQDMVVRKKVMADQAPKGAVSSPQDVIGLVAIEPLAARQPIRSDQVVPRGQALGLAGMVPSGMRAVTVGLDPVMGVAGLLKPGDRVDVVATFEVGDTMIARTVLQDVELLALGKQTVMAAGKPTAPAAGATAADPAPQAGKQTGAPATEAGKAGEQKPADQTATQGPVEQPNATLAVSPEEAQALVLADRRGKLRLALRPVREHDIVPLPTTNLTTVGGPEFQRLQQAKAVPPASPSAAPQTTQVPAALAPAAPQHAPPPTAAAVGARPGSTGHPTRGGRPVEVIRGGQREQVVP